MAIIGRADEITRKGIVGWAADKENPHTHLEVRIIVNGTEVGRVCAENYRADVKESLQWTSGKCGFEFEFAPALSVWNEYRVEATVVGTDYILPPGPIELLKPAVKTAPLLPIIITSSGRAGSTLLMQHLADIPEVVTALAYPYEVKLVNYYSAAFNVLAADEDRTNSTHPDTIFDESLRCLIGSNPYTRLGNHGDGLTQAAAQHFFKIRVPAILAETFCNLTLEYYNSLKQAQKKPFARYFAEKSSLDEVARNGPRVLFGGVREILLIRDPRDLVCSAKAFWKLPGAEAIRMVSEASARKKAILENKADDLVVIKYEDLIIEPVETLNLIADFIGIARRQKINAAKQKIVFQRHATSETPKSSIGRWRKDLSKKEIEACDKLMGGFIAEWGYDKGITA